MQSFSMLVQLKHNESALKINAFSSNYRQNFDAMSYILGFRLLIIVFLFTSFPKKVINGMNVVVVLHCLFLSLIITMPFLVS